MSASGVHGWFARRWYGRRPSVWLLPLSALFVLLTALRRAAYRTGLLRSHSLPVPVIVVGNITVGGTGKTPFVIWLIEALHGCGHRPGVVTRGYGGEAIRWPVAVTADSDSVMVGDEAVLLARRTRVPVAAGPDRVAAARLLLSAGVDVIVSDDGLQHYRLQRDLEIVMLDAARGLGNGWRLPAGPLREAPRRLAQADLVVAKTVGCVPLRLPVTALPMCLDVEAVRSLDEQRTAALGDFAGQRVHAVAGIGNPQQFFELLATRGLEVDAHALPDHARLAARDLAFHDGLPVFMTEKDAIKCRSFAAANCWYVRVAARFAERDAEAILALVRRHLPAAA